MKRILLAILSSNQNLYTRNTNSLKHMYKQIIDMYSMDIDVISYTASGISGIDGIQGDTLFVDCDDKDLNAKSIALGKYIGCHPEYDVVIKTNCSTVLNLPMLNFFVNSDNFHDDIVYGSSFIEGLPGVIMEGDGVDEYIKDKMVYIRGTFTMMDTKLFLNTIGNEQIYTATMQRIASYKWAPTIPPYGNDCENYFTGIPDDMVWGVILYLKSINLAVFEGLSFSNLQCENGIHIYSHDIDILDHAVFYEINTQSDYNIRANVEPMIIELVAKYFTTHHMTKENYLSMLSSIKTYSI